MCLDNSLRNSWEEDARGWARGLFEWYNHEHHHTGLGLLTPVVVHRGQAAEVRAARQATLDAFYAAHPQRFVRGRPQLPALPEAVWINLPMQKEPSPSGLSATGTEERVPLRLEPGSY